MDELPLLLWENPPVCPCLSIPRNVPGGMALNTGSVGIGRKGPLALWGVICPTHKGGGTSQGPSALLSWSTGLRDGSVCVCVSLAKHFKVPQTRCPRWGPHLAPVDFVSPARPIKTERSPQLALENVPERRGCALVCVYLVTTRSRVLQDLSHRICCTAPWKHTGAAGDTCVIPLGFISWFFGNYKCSRAKSWRPGE